MNRFDLLDKELEEEFYCKVGYFIDNLTGDTGDFEPYPYVLKYVNLLNELWEENNKLKEENEQLRNELTFLNKVISFFADNPMTKYSSKSELLEEMKLLEEMGLI